MIRAHRIQDSPDWTSAPNGLAPHWSDIEGARLLALAVVTGLFLGPLCLRTAGIYDEGLIVYGAARVMDGDIPHRDFWTLYAPGQFYALAGLFKLFGTSLVVERLWDTAVRVGISLSTYLIAARISSTSTGLIPYCLSVLSLGSVGFYAYPLFPALWMALLGYYFLLRALSLGAGRSFAIAGFLFGLATAFKTEIGILGASTSGMVVLAYGFKIIDFSADGKSGKQTPRLGAILLFGTGFAVPVLIEFLYMLSAVAPSVLWENMVAAPRELVAQYRWLPKPNIIPHLPAGVQGFDLAVPLILSLTFEWLPFYGPVAILLFAIAVYVQRHISRSAVPGDSVVGALSVFGLAIGLVLSDRPDELHLFPSTLVASIALTHLFFGAWRKRGHLRVAVFATACLVVFAGSHVVLPAYRCFLYLKYSWTSSPSSMDRAGFVRITPDEEQAVRFIMERVPEGERIFVGLPRHDRIRVCDDLFYFLSGRHASTRYHDLVPGVATTSEVQTEIIESIQSNLVRFVVLCSWFSDKVEPNLSNASSGVLLLDTFIRENFSEVAQFGHYRILERQVTPERMKGTPS